MYLNRTGLHTGALEAEYSVLVKCADAIIPLFSGVPGDQEALLFASAASSKLLTTRIAPCLSLQFPVLPSCCADCVQIIQDHSLSIIPVIPKAHSPVKGNCRHRWKALAWTA